MKNEKLYNLNKDSAFLISTKALIFSNEKLLILRSSMGDKLWEVPGGLLEYEEDLEDCLKREVKEETNLDIKIKYILAALDYTKDRPFTFRDGRVLKVRTIALFYDCDALTNDVKLNSWEQIEYKWADLNEIKKLKFWQDTGPAIQKFYNQIINK